MGALLTSKQPTSPPPLISHQSVTALRQDSTGSVPSLPSTPPVVSAGVPQLERIKSDHPRLSASEDSNSPKISAKPAPPGATVCKWNLFIFSVCGKFKPLNADLISFFCKFSSGLINIFNHLYVASFKWSWCSTHSKVKFSRQHNKTTRKPKLFGKKGTDT